MAKYYNKSVLVSILKEKAAVLGRTPMPEDMVDPGAQVFLNYFKKWDKAIKAAGLKQKMTVDRITPLNDKVEPAIEEVVAPKTAAVEVEDVTPQKDAPSQRRYSKSIISKMLVEEFNRLGKKPTRKEIDANKELPTVATCLKYFDTTRIGDVWEEVLKDEA
ncbi:homing endonuclease associated repeat-containing protein [Eubacterium barkeri]|uniref:Uncharacterized protein n=1 Tax=Eubacterium barkeri TaxID=1528 RepID=A0A1H3BLF4_EUBBA|nr:hypothetical protein [Eubacterium barkeri]SDX42727.1 hypothetical protein SAMN04488579_102125 [Eubacterium barkeri]